MLRDHVRSDEACVSPGRAQEGMDGTRADLRWAQCDPEAPSRHADGPARQSILLCSGKSFLQERTLRVKRPP
jgi:hypothetical protein